MREKPQRVGDRITRRQFLGTVGAAAGWLAVSGAYQLSGFLSVAATEEASFTPGGPPPPFRKRPASRPRVVHLHSSDATSWDFDAGWFGDFVGQAAVDEMVDRGVMALTGTDSRATAWKTLLPAYVPGQRIAIKVNLNNARDVDDSDNIIDALIEPVNSVIKGLKGIGVSESDIWVYDASRSIPARFRNGCDFPGVVFSGRDVNPQGFGETEKVTFGAPPSGPALEDQAISQVLTSAHYLINMPIMKMHGSAHVTLAFKNHFGSIEKCWKLHDLALPGSGAYTSEYSPLVDIYQNPHFVGKTVLTLGDGLYGSRGHQSTRPDPWATFGVRAPNSLFFSQDPVAIDCVMYDFLEAEVGIPPAGDDYLFLAAQEGLGVFEHRAQGASTPDNWYSLIEYIYLDLDALPKQRLYVPLAQR